MKRTLSEHRKIAAAYDEYIQKVSYSNEQIAQQIVYNVERGLKYQCNAYEALIEVLDENNHLLARPKYRKAFAAKMARVNQSDKAYIIKRFDLVILGYSGIVGRVVDINPANHTAQVSFWERVFTFDLSFLRTPGLGDNLKDIHKHVPGTLGSRQVG